MLEQIKNKFVAAKDWVKKNEVEIISLAVITVGTVAVIAGAYWLETRPAKIVADIYNPETGYLEHKVLGQVAYNGKVTWTV